MQRSYVGVAGFVKQSDINDAILAIPENNKTPLAIGILSSAKTLAGTRNKYPNRYPAIDEISNLARCANHTALTNRSVLSVLHYSFDTAEDFERQLRIVDELLDQGAFGGLQINASASALIDPRTSSCVDKILQKHGNLRVIAQFRPPRGSDPWVDLGLWVVQLAENTANISDILIDSSAGSGREFDSAMVSSAISMIRLTCHAAGIGRNHFGVHIAGGLAQGTLPKLSQLFAVHGQLGFDVESGVRDQFDQMSTSSLRAYLELAYAITDR